MVAVKQIVLGVVRWSSWRWSAGCLLAIGTATYSLRGTPLTDHYGYYPIHLGVMTLLIAGFLFRDRFARALRTAAPFAIPLLAMFAMAVYDRLFPDVSHWIHLQYVATLTACSFVYWLEIPLLQHLIGALVTAGSCCATFSRQLYALLQNSFLEKGLLWLTWGMAFLAIAVLISFGKGGMIRRLGSALHRMNDARRGNSRPTE
jgi:hypothetical protein